MSRLEVRNRLLHLHYGQILTNQQLIQWLEIDPTFIYWERKIPPFWPRLPSLTVTQQFQLRNYHATYHSTSLPYNLFLQNTNFMTILDTDYPPQLKEIWDPPVILYAKGDLEKLQSTFFLAVVGARKSDHYTMQSLKTIVPALLTRDVCIVSGMAAGADGQAHWLSLKGSTIGVLGSGFDHLYPAVHAELYQEMITHQLLLSEYPPFISPQKRFFPMRNRIIAGLSRGVLVTQAAVRSGSMITVDRALEEGRDVFAVPGPIHHELSMGTNYLIQQGAKLVTNSKDIMEEWGMEENPPQSLLK
ncbi:DNA-processing protein DprA [Jeotgalibacillus marinus]|uniref:DNA-processing protein DprA n=1 Tax=Jeotgalibacillus marinus TaxID=86667 RepID=A0ABV3Q1U1_9BACL